MGPRGYKVILPPPRPSSSIVGSKCSCMGMANLLDGSGIGGKSWRKRSRRRCSFRGTRGRTVFVCFPPSHSSCVAQTLPCIPSKRRRSLSPLQPPATSTQMPSTLRIAGAIPPPPPAPRPGRNPPNPSYATSWPARLVSAFCNAHVLVLYSLFIHLRKYGYDQVVHFI